MCNSPKTARLFELDALRGLAALAVVICHYSSYCYRYDEGFNWNFHLGSYGAHLFFMISGFVIFMTLGRCKSPGDFLFSRFSRLYPTYWLAVLFSTAMVLIFSLPKFDVSFSGVLGNLTMLQTWLKLPDIEAAYWTLGVELKFYGLMFVFYLLARRFGSWLCIEKFSCVWLAGIIVFRLTGYFWNLPHALSTPLILDYAHLFVAGIMFFRIRVEGYKGLRVAIILAAIPMQFMAEGFEATLVATSFLLVFYLVTSNKLTFIASRPLIYLGNISYPLYLIHGAFGYAIIRILMPVTSSAVLLMVVPTVASIAVSHAMTFYFERPSLDILRRWYKEQKTKRSIGAAWPPGLVGENQTLN